MHRALTRPEEGENFVTVLGSFGEHPRAEGPGERPMSLNDPLAACDRLAAIFDRALALREQGP
ncbi:MAG: hypothetical protein JOZ63_13300, partial [Planctomycetaceae bacterium]|nr:hypothetical protein [Planctomycetaceae bacterium]